MTARQKLFIEKYLGEANLNGAKAARLAGYSRTRARQEASELLARRDVRRAIEKRLDAAAMSASEAMFRLSEQGRGTLEPFLYDDYEDDELTPRGILKLDTEAARENAHLIKEATQVILEFEGGRKVTNKVKLHDSQAALIHILRAHGVFKDSGSELMKTIDVSRLSTRQLQRLAAGEDLLKILLLPDGADASPEDDTPVEDDLPDAI